MPKVFIINRGAGHDFSKAEKFGPLIYLSEGPVNRTETGKMVRAFMATLSTSAAEDYILLSSLSIMCSIACAIMGTLHKRLNLLIFEKGDYIERRMYLDGRDTQAGPEEV